MDSEKVKEIRKALEFCVSLKKRCRDCDYNEIGCYKLLKDSLTYINELESENETFLKSKTMWKRLHTELCKENQQLKKKIAELEKENAKLLDSVETVQSNRCVYKCELTKRELKQFAEKLKEKCEFNRKEYCCDATVSAGDIDETLKEFLL